MKFSSDIIIFDLEASCKTFGKNEIEESKDCYGEKNKSILSSFGIYYDLPLLRKEVRVSGLNYGDYFVGGGLDVRSLAIYYLAKNKHSTSGISIEHL